MKKIQIELKEMVNRVKTAHENFQNLIQNQEWFEELKQYAEKQGGEVKKLFTTDLDKMRKFLEKERKEVERIQKKFPVEMKKFRNFMKLQKKEFEKLLVHLKKVAVLNYLGPTPPREKKASKKSRVTSSEKPVELKKRQKKASTSMPVVVKKTEVPTESK